MSNSIAYMCTYMKMCAKIGFDEGAHIRRVVQLTGKAPEDSSAPSCLQLLSPTEGFGEEAPEPGAIVP